MVNVTIYSIHGSYGVYKWIVGGLGVRFFEFIHLKAVGFENRTGA